MTNKMLVTVDLEGSLYATVFENDHTRFMAITDSVAGDGLIQGRMDLNNPVALLSKYMIPMTMAGLHWASQAPKITVLGLGVGAIPRFLRAAYQHSEITIAERFPQIVELADTYFFEGHSLRDSYRVVWSDYMAYLSDRHAVQDILMVDVFTNKPETEGMDSPGFYRLCRNHVGVNGVVVVNLITDNPYQCLLSAHDVFRNVYKLDQGLPDNQFILVASMNPGLEKDRYDPT